MAELSTADRAKISAGLQRYFSAELAEVGLTKAQLQAAINATDTWIDGNAASYNAALPAAAQAALTAAQKTLLFCIVAAYRVSQAFAVRLIGGVD